LDFFTIPPDPDLDIASLFIIVSAFSISLKNSYFGTFKTDENITFGE
jgi:hypothetical protein